MSNNVLQSILKRCPSIKQKREGKEIRLTDTEKVFEQLTDFIDKPDNNSFDLRQMYDHLRDDDLIFALQVVIRFFRNETYLIKDQEHLLLKELEDEEDELYNQTLFANYLTDHGHEMSRNKLAVYYQRGKLPDPDYKAKNRGTPYWYLSTVKRYLESLNGQKNEN